MSSTLRPSLAPVHDVEIRLRDLVNMTRRRRQLQEQGARWHQLCSAMDIIGDTQLAIMTATDESIRADSDGAKYLMIYGVLQTLYLQQDAANTINKCLDLDVPIPDELSEVRDTRNAAAGHPTVYKGSGAGIVRFTLSADGFELVKWSQNGDYSRQSVNLSELCPRQASAIHGFLSEVVRRLEVDEMEHRSRHRDESLEAILEDGLLYAFEKLSAAARGDDILLWEYGVDTIADRLRALRQAIEDRGYRIGDLDALNYSLTEADFSIERLRQYFRGERPGTESRDATVYVGFLHSMVDKIRSLCREMDQEYLSDTV